MFRVSLVSLVAVWVAMVSNAQSEAPPALLQMIRDDSIHEELNLNSQQIEQVLQSLAKVDPPWFRSRNLPAGRVGPEIDRLSQVLWTDLSSILTSDQFSRLEQLHRQAFGNRMLVRPEIVEALGIEPSMVRRLSAGLDRTDSEVAKMREKIDTGELAADEAGQAIEQFYVDQFSELTAELTAEQRQRLAELIGEPFAFSQVTRRYPLAPPLQTEGVKWIQNGPLSLDQLKGKVVAVHFYAYQCINCQRNFPHYQRWHQDYADDGLVVIGIQTPETSAERDFDRVARAARSDGFQYPVVLDSASLNWKAYGTRMWPTVYLIDKQGFLRRWWEGELNWQGATGEQQLRATIEQMLEE